MALKNVAPRDNNKPTPAEEMELDDMFDDGQAATEGDAKAAANETVRLTDISEIVSKYAVVDRFFDGPSSDEPATSAGQDEFDAYEAEDSEVVEEPEEEMAPETSAPAPQPAESPRSMLFSPLARRRKEEELYSNWSDTARGAIREIGSTKMIFQQPTEEYVAAQAPEPEAEPEMLEAEAEVAATVPPRPNLVKRHRRTLIHTAALCTALPVVAGVTFVLTVYTQKDIKPSELWSWATASVSGIGESEPLQSDPEEALIAARQPDANALTTPTVAPSEQAAAVSPEDLSVPVIPGLAAIPDGSAPVAADEQGPPATQLYMARLTVADAHGSSMEPIPLTLNLTRGQADQRLRIRISGLPIGALLSSGVDLGNGEWGLQEEDLRGLTMSLPQGFTGEITLLAMVIDDATHIQAGETTPLQVHVAAEPPVVQPAAAAAQGDVSSFGSPDAAETQSPGRSETVLPRRSLFPELNLQLPDATPLTEQTEVATLEPVDTGTTNAEPVPPLLTPTGSQLQMTAEEISALISRGDRMLDLGDISSARLFYERAARSGDAVAATALGKSYDPLIFGSLQVRGVRADPELARVWYMRGVQGGDVEANANLQRLDAWLSQQ